MKEIEKSAALQEHLKGIKQHLEHLRAENRHMRRVLALERHRDRAESETEENLAECDEEEIVRSFIQAIKGERSV
jgi:hypothetical protein